VYPAVRTFPLAVRPHAIPAVAPARHRAQSNPVADRLTFAVFCPQSGSAPPEAASKKAAAKSYKVIGRVSVKLINAKNIAANDRNGARPSRCSR